MKTVAVEKANIRQGSLILINRKHPICEKLEPELVPVDSGYPEILLEQKAAAMYAQLIQSLQAGGQIVPVSGYRSLQEQEKIYAESMRENGEDFTRKFVAYPNHSEHQSGLAIDVGENRAEIDFIRPDFPYTGICQAFRQRAAQFGFIERYPKGKEAITGIAHEPWHFRYVGCPHAELMQREQLTLEEYTEYLKDFPYGGKHLHFDAGRHTAEIYYVRESALSSGTIPIPDDTPCEVSGNNVDGFVVTVWRSKK
ncbi:M15 family metallopeptidase [Brevibacillus ruminantium]|uniref:M15 family metallopeptidase n=1 Tax=Brevibacillus ruminantium TaxID=2950604 RepID=A0ABY4WCJ3_9BACL|nr:M15 family metallopeptidase [Brevibacillus ruminantium]USG64561.1 M15 family metallopeptidase [Brevibacillus ruminantium]